MYACRQVLGVYIISGNKTTTNKTNKPCFEICEAGVHPSHITAGRHSEEEESWASQDSKQFWIKQLFPTFWAKIWIVFHEPLYEAKPLEVSHVCMGIKEDGATSLHRPFLRYPRKRKVRKKNVKCLRKQRKSKNRFALRLPMLPLSQDLSQWQMQRYELCYF